MNYYLVWGHRVFKIIYIFRMNTKNKLGVLKMPMKVWNIATFNWKFVRWNFNLSYQWDSIWIVPHPTLQLWWRALHNGVFSRKFVQYKEKKLTVLYSTFDNWPLVKNLYFCPIFMKLGENDCHDGNYFHQLSWGVDKKLLIFYKWPIFEHGHFFTQTLGPWVGTFIIQ